MRVSEAALKPETFNMQTDAQTTEQPAAFAALAGSAACVKYGCWRTPLKYMKAGDSHQTANGFFTIMISGWYCPRCGAGYGKGLKGMMCNKCGMENALSTDTKCWNCAEPLPRDYGPSSSKCSGCGTRYDAEDAYLHTNCAGSACSAACGNCRFFKPIGDAVGQCRRFPPIKSDKWPHDFFPQVSTTAWCGEHQPPNSKLCDLPRKDTDGQINQ